MAIPDWLNISQLSGSGDTIITITASTLEGLVERTTTLRVSGNTKYVDVEVTQAPHDYAEDYLTFEITSPGVIYWRLTGASSGTPLTIEYRQNGGTWTQITATRSGNTSISVTTGDVLEFRGDNPAYGGSARSSFQSSTAGFKASGNIMSLVSSSNFTNLTTLSEDRAFAALFYGCSGLTDARNLVLPATALTDYCYDGMFDLCRSLAYAPKLPATTLAPYCYHEMFDGCNSLTTAPELPATVMQTSCYDGMFANCTGLRTAPVLPATTLEFGCYAWMFDGCTSLVTPPALPATTLAIDCYDGMFNECSSLTTAPDLPARVLVSSCYRTMFTSCQSLNYIKCLGRNPSSGATFNWGYDVAPTGTFVKHPDATWDINSIHGIPPGWTVVDADIDDYENEYLTFNITGAGDINWKRNYSATARKIQYSKNGGAWTTLTPDSVGVKIYGLVPGDVVRFKGTNTRYGDGHTFGNADTAPVGHVTTAQFTMSGNIMSLIYGDDFIGKTSFPSGTTNNFNSLFNTVTGLTSVENLVLPVTSLTDSCYSRLFKNCSGLTKSPKTIPAIEVSHASCAQMFMYCTSLVTTPVLSCTNLAETCYSSMFEGCSSLAVAPDLPATKVYMYSYRAMFALCTSLVNPPDMAMTTLANDAAGACMEMFSGCASLVRSPHLKPLELYSYNGYGCYGSMFADCSSLTRIDCDAVSLMPSSSGSTLADATGYWVNGVAASGTFYKNPNATWTTGDDGIPTGWTVVNAT